ncbi:MAG TPA: hypothetical protein VLX68_16750 [Chitinivibrionales bacterium]|nr:hypothetical protein [Chitinivibrionales bacterium]
MESPHNHYYRNNREPEYQSMLEELWDSFWNGPRLDCPKCGSKAVEYYDPFFFSPIRTLKGHRRVKCTACKFIWRPSRRRKSFWKGLRPFI